MAENEALEAGWARTQPVEASARDVPTGAELEAQQKHAALLERVIRFGLNQSQYLIDVQVNIFPSGCRGSLILIAYTPSYRKWCIFASFTWTPSLTPFVYFDLLPSNQEIEIVD